MKKNKTIVDQKDSNSITQYSTIPPIIPRQDIPKWFGNIISKGYLANLASIGKGPSYIKSGRKILYRRDVFIEWLLSRGIEVITIEQNFEKQN